MLIFLNFISEQIVSYENIFRTINDFVRIYGKIPEFSQIRAIIFFQYDLLSKPRNYVGHPDEKLILVINLLASLPNRFVVNIMMRTKKFETRL